MPVVEQAVTLMQIKKTYRLGTGRGRRAVVEELSLGVNYGDIFGLLGPNGAGKTTTLKIMLGLVFPESGKGTLLGKKLGDRAAHTNLGFLPEQSYFYGFLTAEKGLALYGKFFGLDGKALKTRSAELLELVGLPRDSHLTINKYSKGMVQRFGIAQALLNDPKLVVLDEPSSGLDPVGQKEVRDILLRLKDEGKTIFLSSHQLSEVENICDSVSIMNKGRPVIEGKLAELLTIQGLTRITLAGDLVDGAISGARQIAVSDDGQTVIEVDSKEVYDALDQARHLGLELISTQPYHRSLEDLFLETVKENADTATEAATVAEEVE
jgi:ABC-2 type transport system ATP-binding protein